MKKEIEPAALSKRRRRPGSRLVKSLICAAALLFAVLLIWEYLVIAISDVQLLARREVGRTASLEGILIKEEKVIRAPAAGRLHFTAVDGERLELGARAAQVVASEQDSGERSYSVPTSVAGIVCSHLDGLENILAPGNLDVLELPKLEKIGDKPVPEGSRVEKGQPVFKMIDNLSPILVYTEISKSEFPGLADKQGWYQATWEALPLRIKPVKGTDTGERWEGFFRLSGYPEQLLHSRKVRLQVTAETLKGFLVESKAIVQRNGEPGIYLAVKKEARWAPVTIEGELEGQVAISGKGLGENTRYVTNPVLVREGWLVE